MSNVWGTPEPPGFTVQRVTDDGSGGDFVRGMPTTRQNALRYKVRSVEPSTASAKVAVKSTITAVTTGYGAIDLSWGWPEGYEDWTEVAIVRSGFGHPSTVNDGVTIFRSTRDEYQFFDGLTALTITITDDELQAGRWYYYTLFFFRTEWEPVMFTEALTPRDFGHFDHLWNGIPEYYRWVDSRFRGQQGHLQQFLKMFGFELDLTREHVESWQETYNIDNSPQPLLYEVGLNLGVATDQGLGEIRTRSLISQINQLYEKRGTAEGLKLVVEASSKFDTTVTNGRNMLLLPDDSEFLTGPGNWLISEIGVPLPLYNSVSRSFGTAFDATCTPAPTKVFTTCKAEVAEGYGFASLAVATSMAQLSRGFGNAFDALVTVTPATSFYPEVAPSNANPGGSPLASGLAYDAFILATPAPKDVTLAAPFNTADKDTDAGHGLLAVLAGNNRPAPSYYANSDLTLACGLGITAAAQGSRVLTPKYHGVPVEQNVVYGFSCHFKAERLTSAVTVGIYWFDRNELFLGTSESVYPVTGAWQTLLVQGLSFYSNNATAPMMSASASGTAFNAMVSGGVNNYSMADSGAGDGYGVAFDALISRTNTTGTALSQSYGAAQSVAYDAMIYSNSTVANVLGYDEAKGEAFDAGVLVNEYRKYLANNSRRTIYSEYAGASFAIPYITVSGRDSGDDFKLMGCMFYDAGPGGTTTAVAPDFYLTLGTGELLGAESGKVIGG